MLVHDAAARRHAHLISPGLVAGRNPATVAARDGARHTALMRLAAAIGFLTVVIAGAGAWLLLGSRDDTGSVTSPRVAPAAAKPDAPSAQLPPLPDTRPRVVEPEAGATAGARELARRATPRARCSGPHDRLAPAGRPRRPPPRAGATATWRAPPAAAARGDRARARASRSRRSRRRRPCARSSRRATPSRARRTSGAAATAAGRTRATTARARSPSRSPPPGCSTAR